MGSLQEDSGNGKDNPAFDHKHDMIISTNGQVDQPEEKKISDNVDLVSNLVHDIERSKTPTLSNGVVSLPLYEISLNGNSIKKLTLSSGKSIGGDDNDAGQEKGNDYSQDEEQDMRCGLGCFSPDWIQQFATKKAFLVVFSLLGVIQGMTWSYFTATITTLEKRFKISSQTAGIVMTGNEISQILFSVFIAYFGGKGHRPRWISVGVLFSAISCFVLASPQAFYGSGDDALALTEEYAHIYDQSSNLQGYSQTTLSSHPFSSTENDILQQGSSTLQPSLSSNKIGNVFPSSKKRGKVSTCQPGSGSAKTTCEDVDSDFAPLIIIFLSQFVAGIGNLLFFSLGGPYLDDNTSRNNMPRVLGCTMSLRLVGPAIGFVIASGTLKMFVNPMLTPIISQDDPRWIGAWWLGWVIFGTSMLIMSSFIALFPRRLRRKHQKSVDPTKINSPETIPKINDIPLAVKSLLKNKVNLFNILAGVFYLFAGIGYWTYMPKYLETIFMQTASSASIISGGVGILFQSSGMMLSGFLISKFQPSARKLAAWNVIIALTSVAVIVSFTQIGCDVGTINFGSKSGSDNTWNLTTECNADCNCKTSKILPVCYEETNTVYYSACHAGCTEYDGKDIIGNCKCVGGSGSSFGAVGGLEEGPKVKLGNCAGGCTGIFILFLGISAAIKFFEATGRIGNMLISYRCVELKDRSLSIGLNILMISLFAFLPSPILFGRIIDNVCLVWGRSACGNKQGNCMLYDGQQLRYVFNLTAAAFTLIGGLLDCLVLYYVKDMELYKEPIEEELENQMSKKYSISSCHKTNEDDNITTSFTSGNNNKNSLSTSTGDKLVGGGGGFVNLCFNDEKSEK